MNDTEISYRAAVRYARRHIQDCCYGRPCLEDCLRRLGASLPPCACAGGWRPPRWAKWLALAAVLAVFLFACLRSNADVRCLWDGDTYVCSGEGARVEVIGGGSGEPVVVTNLWGVCTNCVAISPSNCQSLRNFLLNDLDTVHIQLLNCSSRAREVFSSVTNMEADISTFQRFENLPVAYPSVNTSYTAFTNYVFTVENTQALLCRDQFQSMTVVNPVRLRYLNSYNNGIYDYAQTLTSPLSSQREYLDDVIVSAEDALSRVDSLASYVDRNLVCDECQPEYVPGGPPGGGGGGSNTGRWCTEEQGDAIIELLGDLKAWAERQHVQLSSINNYVRASYKTLRSGLYSDYTAIPRGEDWQNLYLNGQPTGWGYDPTNIIQRIEVLLYGISGISTNTASLDDTTPSADDTVKDVSDAAASIATDADGTAATTLGNAVLDFFRAFTPRTKNYQGGEEIIAEVSIKVGNDTHYVPAMRLGSSGFLLDTMTAVKTCVNGFCCVIFWVGGAFVIFRFWAWFSAWCIRLSKWAVELCTSLFAS